MEHGIFKLFNKSFTYEFFVAIAPGLFNDVVVTTLFVSVKIV